MLVGFFLLESFDLSGFLKRGRWAKIGGFPAESFIEQDVLGRAVYPLFSPNDMGNCHEMIVHHACEVIGWQTVRFLNHLVVDLRPFDPYLTSQFVLESTFSFVGYLESHHIRFSSVFSFFCFFRRKGQAVLIVAWSFLVCNLLFTKLFQAIRSAKTKIGMPFVDQSLHFRLIQCGSFTLPIGDRSPRRSPGLHPIPFPSRKGPAGLRLLIRGLNEVGRYLRCAKPCVPRAAGRRPS